ncbi:hypothetical protein [Mycolicibacter minnesotensis]
MPERGDEQREREANADNTVDRLEEKVAKEYGSDSRARETPRHGDPDEPPD